MASFMQRYREAMEHKHGWDVELECGRMLRLRD